MTKNDVFAAAEETEPDCMKVISYVLFIAAASIYTYS